MLKRPTNQETEEDLLKLEEEFLKSQGKERPKKELSKSESQTLIVGDIVEKHEINSGAFKVTHGHESFPSTFIIKGSKQSGKQKKSLFALQIEGKAKQRKQQEEVEVPMQADRSIVVTGVDAKAIHDDNMRVLSNMSEEEILASRKSLLGTMKPELVEFLTKKRKMSSIEKLDLKESKMEVEECGGQALLDVDEKWLNMDVVEHEKLAWTGDVPDSKALEPGETYQARFDFNGDLQPFSKETDVRNALHHHGDEPERPGYTIQELYQLCRSSVHQQRVIALNTLANVMWKCKAGFYDHCFDGQLLSKLVESDLFFLIRFSLDETPLVPVAVRCLHHLFVNHADEVCLDKLLGVVEVDVQPLMLLEDGSLSEKDEAELKDHALIAYDLVKGVLRTDVLQRLSYIGTRLDTSRELAVLIVETLTRVARHSVAACEALVKTPQLLHFVYSLVACQQPVHQAVKLLRVLASASTDIAHHLATTLNLDIILKYVDADEATGMNKREWFLVKLQSLYLWRCLLLNSLLKEELNAYSPCFTRMLRFYFERLDLEGSDFDYELYSAILGVLRCDETAAAQVCPLVELCLEKWLTQLSTAPNYTYTRLKAVGAALFFLSHRYRKLGVSTEDVQCIRKTNHLLTGMLFKSKVFADMCDGLLSHSHVLHFRCPARDPDNLPSLCAVYDGGQDHLRIVQSSSPFSFFGPLVEYVARVRGVLGDLASTGHVLLQCLDKYVRGVTDNTARHDNWFMRVETGMLSQLVTLSEDPLALGFTLLTYLRSEDERVREVLSNVCAEHHWGVSTVETYARYVPRVSKALVLPYKAGLVSTTWMYLPLKDTTCTEVKTVLTFLGSVLTTRPELLAGVTATQRYYHLVSVFLNDAHVLDPGISTSVEPSLQDMIANCNSLDLCVGVKQNKSFYDLYTELVTQYAGVSYGNQAFGLLVLLPLQNRHDASYRKLLWSEYVHVVRVLTLPFPLAAFPDLSVFTTPVETDPSLLTTYMSSLERSLVTPQRNPFIYRLTVENIKEHLKMYKEEKLAVSLLKRTHALTNLQLQSDLLS